VVEFIYQQQLTAGHAAAPALQTDISIRNAAEADKPQFPHD
jgi:hypothetical protein